MPKSPQEIIAGIMPILNRNTAIVAITTRPRENASILSLETARPEYVISEKQGKIKDDAHHSRGYRSKWHSKRKFAMRGFDEWAAHENKDKARQEGKEGYDGRAGKS